MSKILQENLLTSHCHNAFYLHFMLLLFIYDFNHHAVFKLPILILSFSSHLFLMSIKSVLGILFANRKFINNRFDFFNSNMIISYLRFM